jgi:uncharacterized damage-inducible protein DinB
VDPGLLLSIYRFTSWANEGVREGMARADEGALRRPIGLWFGSVMEIAAHLYAGEAIWLARLRDGTSPPRLLTAADFSSAAGLIDAWRAVDAAWEAYVATLTPASLDEPIHWTSQFRERLSHLRWQILMHVPFHCSEHRAHVATGLTMLGVSHGPQDFHLQFLPPDVVARRQSAPPGNG